MIVVFNETIKRRVRINRIRIVVKMTSEGRETVNRTLEKG